MLTIRSLSRSICTEHSELLTRIGTLKVHSISDTLEVYCYLQCEPTTFST